MSIYYDEVWFHHCPICKTDFCEKCNGKIDPELHNPLYYKTWEEMNRKELMNALFPFVKNPIIDFGYKKNKTLAINDEQRSKIDETLKSVEHFTNENNIKVKSHKCVLQKHPAGQNNGWNCDKITGAKRCLSGMTDFYMAKLAKPEILGYRCTKCNYDLCTRCVKADIYINELLNRED